MKSIGCFPGSSLTKNDPIKCFCTSIVFALVELKSGKSHRVKTDKIFEKGVEILKKTIGMRRFVAGIDTEGYILDVDDGFTLSEVSLRYAQEKSLGVEISFLEDFWGNLKKLAAGEKIPSEEIYKLIDYFEFARRALKDMPSEPAFP